MQAKAAIEINGGVRCAIGAGNGDAARLCCNMTPPRVGSAEPEQTVEQIAAALESFLAEHPKAVVMEDGKVLFDMRTAKYSLGTEHGRCTLQLWGDEGNIVRRVSRTAERNKVLRLKRFPNELVGLHCHGFFGHAANSGRDRGASRCACPAVHAQSQATAT